MNENAGNETSLNDYVRNFSDYIRKMIISLIVRQIEWNERFKIVDTKFMIPKNYGLKAMIPFELKIQPRDYQLQGLYWLSSPTPTGKILADDMGLGKTLQALATAAALPNRDNGRIWARLWRRSLRTTQIEDTDQACMRDECKSLGGLTGSGESPLNARRCCGET